MNNWGEYIIYADESGDHNLENLKNQAYPIFSLAFCIFRKIDYEQSILPLVNNFKFKYWGFSDVILHEHDIRKKRSGDYAILSDDQLRMRFINDLNDLISNIPFQIIAAVIDKHKLKNYSKPSNPYELAMLFCMERLHRFLCDKNQTGKSTHILFESRGAKENEDLELEFRRVCDNIPQSIPTNINFKNIKYHLQFLDKKSNAVGLQIADLIVRPIGLNVLKPQQSNHAFNIIKGKLMYSKRGNYQKIGLKVFP